LTAQNKILEEIMPFLIRGAMRVAARLAAAIAVS
jgi:hypothetical protein